ncbi:sodium:proton antiporter [Blastococcus sp. PRF04-17]|uniref:sodium:proton antiporter n=1 Tax=Blastococcus sp. PRF04-17 TaxID=2933797 RepID=UPI001FF14186|nr:cation:proton antiporter subunit C [Blastococcus sp. PRF04-17]UOX99961.1 cation:proton antiporter subunit C [Blastococcus sp. PRF04-17]
MGLLVAGGVWFVLQRGMLQVVFGFVLLSHAVNVLMLSAGGTDRRGVPFVGRGDPAATADPLPQAFVLTAIVIAFGITVYLLALVRAERSGDADGPGDRGDLADDPAPASSGRSAPAQQKVRAGGAGTHPTGGAP